MPAAAKAPRAPRAPSSFWPMTALMPGLPCRAAPTSVCAAPRSVMVMWATISASGAVALSASIAAVSCSSLPAVPAAAVAPEHLGLAVELLVDAVAELLAHGRALGLVVDRGERDAGLEAVQAVVLGRAVEDQRDALVQGRLHHRRGGRRGDHDGPGAGDLAGLDHGLQVGDLLLRVELGVLDQDLVALLLAVGGDALGELLHRGDLQADRRERDGLVFGARARVGARAAAGSGSLPHAASSARLLTATTASAALPFEMEREVMWFS